MIDRYTKAVLTVIALALLALAGQGAVRDAGAQYGSCGSSKFSACFIQNGYNDPLTVQVR